MAEYKLVPLNSNQKKNESTVTSDEINEAIGNQIVIDGIPFNIYTGHRDSKLLEDPEHNCYLLKRI